MENHQLVEFVFTKKDNYQRILTDTSSLISCMSQILRKIKNTLSVGIAQSMGYADEFTSQGCFYTSNGLSCEVMSAC